mgnify:CR=1 FL=1
MRLTVNSGLTCARVVLLALVGIHLILPFTPANTHPERRIILVSLVLGVLFLTLSLTSYSRPFTSFLTATTRRSLSTRTKRFPEGH